MDNFVFMGGGGATLGLVLSMGILVIMHRSSKQIKTLTPLTLTPGLFNINEPAMLGLPVVLNMNIVIPFVLVPILNAITTYAAMSLEWVPLCTGAIIPWTMPPVISGFLATSSLNGSILQSINIILDVLVYFPFVLTLNRQYVLEEQGQLNEENE